MRARRWSGTNSNVTTGIFALLLLLLLLSWIVVPSRRATLCGSHPDCGPHSSYYYALAFSHNDIRIHSNYNRHPTATTTTSQANPSYFNKRGDNSLVLLLLVEKETDAEEDPSNSSPAALFTTSRTQRTKTLVREMLYRMALYMADMVDTTTTTTTTTASSLSSGDSSSSSSSSNHNYLYYCFYAFSRPWSGTRRHGHCPLRDLGVAWDVTTLLQFFERNYTPSKYPSPPSATAANDWNSTPPDPFFAAALSRLHLAVQSTLRAYLAELVEAGTPARAVAWNQEDVVASVPSLQNSNNNIPTNTDASFSAVALNSQFLRESSNIAHSGLLLLVLMGAAARIHHHHPQLVSDEATPPAAVVTDTTTAVNALVRGILSQQRLADGAWRIRFHTRDDDDDDGNIYHGIEFYPGEAMVALMQVLLVEHQPQHGGLDKDRELQLLDTPTTLLARIVPAMQRAFQFYSNHYQRHKATLDTNYHIWQVQAFARFFHFLWQEQQQQQQQIDNESAKQEAMMVADYVLELCHDIVASRSWNELMRGRSFFPNLQTVEIACGLDALTEGLGVALALQRQQLDPPFEWWWSRMERAVEYLHFVQQQVPPHVAVGHGGLGYGGIQTLEQRLDVTGHAVSALIKVHGFAEHEGLSKG